jgi:DegV family protein with EDD domain
VRAEGIDIMAAEAARALRERHPVDAARLAAAEAPVPVRVIDSRGVGKGLGFAALAGEEAAQAGASLNEAAAAVERRARAVRSLFYVDNLEHLRRGRRIGAAAGLLGTALMIKPLLHIVDGRVALLEKVTTASRALARLEDLAVERRRRGGVGPNRRPSRFGVRCGQGEVQVSVLGS